MRIFLTFLFLLSVTVPVYAGPGGGGWKTAVRKVLGPGTSRLPATTATNVERTIQIQLKRQQAVLAASARRTGKVMIPTEGWKLPCQNMAVCSAKIKSGGFSQEDLEFNLKNDRLALRWYEIVRRDLALMLRQKEEMLRELKVTQLTHRPDYARLIPAEAKYIFVGEEHGFAPLREAFETLGKEEIEELNYSEKKIRERLILTQRKGNKVIRLIKNTFKTGNRYSNKKIINELTRIFGMLGIHPEEKIEPKLINTYYQAVPCWIGKNRGYQLISELV